MEGTSFLVDHFGKSTQLLKCKSWFLTHFHSDHYKGLRASFKQGADPHVIKLVALPLLCKGH